MAAGVPVVATDIPGTRDLVVPGETGFLVRVGHRAGFARWTNQLLDDAALCASAGPSGPAARRPRVQRRGDGRRATSRCIGEALGVTEKAPGLCPGGSPSFRWTPSSACGFAAGASLAKLATSQTDRLWLRVPVVHSGHGRLLPGGNIRRRRPVSAITLDSQPQVLVRQGVGTQSPPRRTMAADGGTGFAPKREMRGGAPREPWSPQALAAADAACPSPRSIHARS